MARILLQRGRRTSGGGGNRPQRYRGGGEWRSTAERLFRTAVVLFAILFLPSPDPVFSAREDSARLVLQKTAQSGGHRVHVVRKGESIAAILRGQQANGSISLALIGRLNPGIRNLNLIHPGQKIVLPGPGEQEPSDPPTDNRDADPPVESSYRIRPGDSISRIILSELKVTPAEAPPIYRIIRKLNPDIEDLNLIRVGQTLRLPPKPLLPPTQPTNTPVADLHAAEKIDTEAAAKKASAADERLGMIRPVIHRMRGTVTATGNHFIPLKESAQITIDCSMIPVVELDDGTAVLLDYGNRLSENLKGMIRQSWDNYAFLTAAELPDGLAAIQGIVRHSRNYRMVPADKPFTLTARPEVLLTSDWWIISNETATGKPYRQGLFLLERGERPLPAELRTFIESNGVALTELTAGRESDPAAVPPPQRAAPADLRGTKGIAFAERLLAALGEAPVRNAEVIVFDEARNGFNLSVTADLLLRKGGKRFILQTKRLPEEFLRVLGESGTEVVPVGDQGQGRPLIEELLRRVGIPVAYGFFHIRIPEEGKRQRLAASFYALRAATEAGPIYLIDFDMPLLQNHGGGGVVRYENKETVQ